MNRPRIGIDLGGTKIEAIVLDPDGRITTRQRVVTPKDSYDDTIEAISGLIDSLPVSDDTPVGIGTPGAVSLVSGLMKNCNSTCLNGQPLTDDLSRRIGREVRIANDADCFALSEASDGAGRDYHSVFGIILGTGVGGGICVNGQLLSGVSAICGEWGHNPLALHVSQHHDKPRPGRPCYCGRTDCVESWLSGPAFEKSYRLASGEALSAAEITTRAEDGEPQAVAVVDQYHDLLALALATVINILDPGAIVFGGGMSKMASLYPEVPKYLERYVFSDRFNNVLIPAEHGDSSGVRGAAWLWP